MHHHNAHTDDERLIGEAAKSQATINPLQTAFDVKRLIGRRFKGSTVQKDVKLPPIVGNSGKPFICVKVKNEDKVMAHLGGNDFDNCIFGSCVQDSMRKNTGKDMASKPAPAGPCARRRMRQRGRARG